MIKMLMIFMSMYILLIFKGCNDLILFMKIKIYHKIMELEEITLTDRNFVHSFQKKQKNSFSYFVLIIIFLVLLIILVFFFFIKD